MFVMVDPSAEAADPSAEPGVNIAAHVTAMADRFPDKTAVVVASNASPGGDLYRKLTFAQLENETNRLARGLQEAGIDRGMRTILMVRPGLEFFALTFALFKIGAVPVLIDPGMGRRQLIRCLAAIEAEAFVGIPVAHVARLLFAGSFRSVRIKVTVGRRWCWGGLTLGQVRSDNDAPFAPITPAPGEPAAILFTSGSTGPAKGVVYEHRMFDAQVRYLNEVYGYHPDEVDLATFPLFALFDAALGMTAVIPDMDASMPVTADPQKIIRAISDHGVTHMFASPALLNKLSRYASTTGITLPTIKRVMTAGAPVPPAVLAQVRSMLSNDADVFTPYGATESLPVASIESRTILSETADRTRKGEGICVGRPLPGMTVRIIAINDEPIVGRSEFDELPDGSIGEICVCGPVVTEEYFRNPAATAAAKYSNGDTVWHRMGDVGWKDGEGRLWFCGRKAHRVRTPGGPMFTIPCEAVFNTHPGVFRTALVGVGAPGDQRPVLCVELKTEAQTSDRAQIERELLDVGSRNQLTRSIRTILFHESFPVDVRHNAKIFREQLANWAERQVR